MAPEELWPQVRSAPLTREELRVFMERAQDCASDEGIRKDRSTWALRAGLWEALAQAALACDAMLARDDSYAAWGTPPSRRERAGD